MPPIKVKHVISFTSQDPKYPVKDLVEGRGPWLNLKGDKSTSLQADLQLEKATKISYVDIGNAGSVLIGLEVGRSAWPVHRPYVTLIPTVTFMTRAEVTSGQNKGSVRMFKPENMDEAALKEEWDRVRILCLQPFPSPTQFGISMLKMYSESEAVSQLQREVSPEVTVNKKDQLMAKLKLSNPENKSGLSNRIKLLETSQLPDGRMEVAKSQHPNSPLSRGAQLLTRAAKIPTQQENVTKKSDLECESLRFLMGLNLSVAEIDHLAIKDIRKRFENKREKPLSVAEMKIFRDIAVDYATRRLEVLENQDTAGHLAARGVRTTELPTKTLQQKRKLEHYNMESKINSETNNGCTQNLKRNLTVQGNMSMKKADEEKEDVNSTFRKFKFGRYKQAAKPTSVQNLESDEEENQTPKYLKNSTTTDKKREVGNPSRNALALLDARVTVIPPKTTKKKKPRKADTKKEEQQSLLGRWVTPTNKMKAKEKHKEFQFSTQPHLYSDSDDNVECISDEDSDISTIPTSRTPSRKGSNSFSHKSPSSVSASPRDTAKGRCLGLTPNNKFNVNVRGGKKSSSSHQNQPLVECPLCSGSFPAKEIETHAASCSGGVPSDADSDDDDNSPSSSREQTCSGLVAECPVCGVQVSAATLEAHATHCASTMFD